MSFVMDSYSFLIGRLHRGNCWSSFIESAPEFIDAYNLHKHRDQELRMSLVLKKS